MAFLTQESKVSYGDTGRGEEGAKQQIVRREGSNAVDDESKGELQALVFGVTQTSQSTLLLKKRKEMREVDEALEFMKEEFKARMEACDERQREFEKKQFEMKEQVARFEKFVQENDAKRSRAEAKAKSESRMRVQHEEKIAALNKQLHDMQQEQDMLDSELDKLRRYQVYLEMSVEASEGEYEEIPDILNRYKTLKGANHDLQHLVGEGETEMDSIRSELNQLRRATQNALLVNNSKIHANQKTLENIRARALKVDNEREMGERFTKDRFRESGQVVMSIKNLHARCMNTARSKTRPVVGKHASPLEQLSEYLKLIQFRITDLQTINNHFVQGEAESQGRAIVAASSGDGGVEVESRQLPGRQSPRPVLRLGGGVRDVARQLCASGRAARRCTEFCRSEGFMLRNEDLPLQVEMYLVCSAVTILLIRVGLYATGYPQLGGNGIHIAHMLWGGLLMFASQMLTFAFLGRHVQRLASVVGGIGFGMFIDELGKFITSDNDYFFKPTPFLLYIGFCILFIVLKCAEPMFNPTRFSEEENLANALQLMSVYSTVGLSKESRLVLLELLENSNPDHPLSKPLKDYVHLPVSASGVPASREHYYLRFRKWISDVYAKLVRNKYAVYVLDTFFILQCATQFLDLTYLMVDGSYYRQMKDLEQAGAAAGDPPGDKFGGSGGSGSVSEPFQPPPPSDEDGFMPHLMASPMMKFLREVASGKLSDTLLLEETDRVTKLHIVQLVAVSFSAVCVLCGVYYLTSTCNCRSGQLHNASAIRFTPLNQVLWNRRKLAFIWFRRSMLVRLFITDSLSLYHSQFRAFGDVIFTLTIVMALSFMINQEESTERMRRLSASGSLDEFTDLPELS
ncbi:Cilia- and flagella-associated protein 73 (Flagella-associated protein 73) (Modifier of inner arms 2 protein) (Mia2p) [Durusdinium trenchii]|uniref:Cilia- and flagella-associated protein 73 (Flagella-associated protein 73) (Modifier of inner arms 2 protein) (Mia2p) n=1 Tax=Durusdinium trenchii TaxID=1381693 RepID=A0ABP0IG33_9DINO